MTVEIAPSHRLTSISINMYSPECLGPACRTLSVSALASATNVQNLAWYYPFEIGRTTTFLRGWVYNGATANGNWDVGIYSDAFARLASTGAVAQSGTSTLQANAFTVTSVTLAPGRYYIAMSSSSATATFFTLTVTAAIARSLGCAQQSSAHPLPSPGVPAGFAQTLMPHFGIHQRTVV